METKIASTMSKARWKKNKECLNGGTCCARALIAKEEDFKAQRSCLEEEIKLKGHMVCFLPKYHCKLNFIEYSSAKIIPCVLCVLCV